MIITEIFVVAITLQISFSLSGKFEKSCWSLIHCIAAQNFVPVLAPLPFIVHRPVTSLGYQVGRSVFWGPKFFKLCPTHFPGGAKSFAGGFTGLIVHMNPTDIYNRVDQGVTIARCRIKRLLFADNLVLLESSEQGLQHALHRFSAAYHKSEWKSALKIRIMSLQKLKTV